MNFRNIPPVIKNLLIVNILVFVAQYIFSVPLNVPGYQNFRFDRLAEYGALWGWNTGHFKIWQLVTHIFMHDVNNIFHLLFNMFTLWMFGSVLENYWGGKRFFNFYMICGIMAGITQLLMGRFDMAVGASGAIMGVMAAFAYLFPNTPLYIMFVPIPVKAKYVIPAFMALDLFGGIARVEGDNIAHWAHLGGALTGLILVYFGNKRNRKTFY